MNYNKERGCLCENLLKIIKKGDKKSRALSQDLCRIANQNYFYKPNINDLFNLYLLKQVSLLTAT
ncbi:MAG: hypothetical protein K2G90_05805, partial [Muribaculaceae bacterium]|nr:hypothetical protein [Muribaculaceae bacterium]